MLSFKAYLPHDKDFNYATNDEDHCTNLFEQYLNQDPIEFGDTVHNSDGLQAVDFAFDEETESNESCSADSKHTSSHPEYHRPLASFSSTPLQEPLPIRLRSKFISEDAPGRSISSSELLSLEGRGDHHDNTRKAPATSSLVSAAPTLRRKGKFCTPATGLHSRSHRITKTPSADMIRPSYHQESSSYNEWTQRFEQISIQTPKNDSQQSPSRNTGTFRDKRPNKITTSFNQGLQQRHQHLGDGESYFSHDSVPQCDDFNHAATAPLPQEWQNHDLPQPSPLSSADYSYGGRPQLERAQTQQYLRHPSSWDNGFVSPLTPDFIPPNQIQPHWLHNLHSNSQSYHENGNALQSAPAITTNSVPDFTSQDLSDFQYEPYAQFVNEDPSSDYAILSPDGFFAPSAEVLSTPLLDTTNNKPNNAPRPQTPPPRSHSISPPLHTRNHNQPHPHPQTPTKPPHHRSKSTYTTTTPHSHSRRQKSLSTLKSPRSATTLTKHPKSTHTLKSAKSLSSSSVSGNSGNGGSGGFGFVNFTEADKSKILTGVAPSGSSKTKARREQEAMDKKRRLSQAAMRAIEEAGGDVESLRRVAEFEEI